MALAKDLSQLSPADTAGGLTPDENPRFVQALVDKWAAERTDYDPKGRLWTSAAGKCSRAMGYLAARIPESDPMDLTGIWNVNLGKLIHDLWQEAITERYPDAGIESRFEVDGVSCRIDALITTADGKLISYELKTIGGYGFKAAIGKIRKATPAEGPKTEHILQAALNGVAANADEIVIGYLAKECLSANMGKGMPPVARFAAEWTFTRDQIEDLAAAETTRIQGILGLLDAGELPARKFPAGMLPPGAEVVDPASGRWEVRRDDHVIDTGTYWACDYCSHQTLCATTEPGRIAVTAVTLGKAAAA